MSVAHIDCTSPQQGVTLITLANERHLNALTPEMSADLRRVWEGFEAEPGERVAILTGAGSRAFSSGNDLTGTPPTDDPGWNFGGLRELGEVTKPVIAAVNGLAVGGGLELALACDIRIASRTATFAAPEPKIGMVATVGGTQRLPRIIGLGRAQRMLLSADSIDADTAAAWGLVTDLAEPGDLLGRALELAARIAVLGPQAVRLTKYCASRAFDLDLQAGLALEREVSVLVRASAESAEGRAAFREKRAPGFPDPTAGPLFQARQAGP
jgi:enoyl-CoA hydratase/carnithine racemase